jgi:hypothetical protein
VVSGGYAPVPAWSLLPNNRRIRGANLAPNPSQGGSWINFWGPMWDWTGTVKPQLDNAKALGLNTVRIIGAADFVASGNLTHATWIANLQTVLAYCRSVGLYYYLTMGSTVHVTPWDTNFATELSSTAAAIVSYMDVIIACDVLQELFSWDTANDVPSYLPTDATTKWNTALRGTSGWTAPLTYSAYSNSEASFVANAPGNACADAVNLQQCGVDYFDIHWYLPEGVGWDHARLAHTWWSTVALAGTRVLFGEYGAPLSWTSAHRVAYYQAMNDTVLHPGGNNERCAGQLAWGLIDQSNVTSNQWSIFNNSSDEANVLAVAPF